ncbi:predicted protein [Lichtheimia corymbifera JMRC:FSU:9682]|uniref:Uncharacterized protein n=1 Tax=Lichtheimia corymbifera JMRC:FSU:9682 TaxID=1263082 RepID=A0A068RWP1_9FUNG|nr:predicted protein [Lichtheimia corymbifera JMRC:FSU:9682]
MKKVKTAATGVNVQFKKGKFLTIKGPKDKVNHLIDFMQQLVVTADQSTNNYVTITNVGPDVAQKLAALNQHKGNSARVLDEGVMHFSVAKTRDEWAIEVHDIALHLHNNLRQSPPPPSIRQSFTCNQRAFLNIDGRYQVLGVAPADTRSPAHQFDWYVTLLIMTFYTILIMCL